MKILISVDIEGVAGVYHSEQVRPGNPEFERARRLMTAEANAAVCGAFDAGASEVFVNDSHGGFRNMPPDLLDERAQVIQGKPRYLSMVSGVELGVAGVCLVGLPLTCPGAWHFGAHHQQLCLCPGQAQRHGAGRGWHLRCAGWRLWRAGAHGLWRRCIH